MYLNKIKLTFVGQCIANTFSSSTNKMQLSTIYLFLWNTLHVSGGSSAHHHELKNCICSIGYFVKPLLLPATTVAGSSKGLTKYAMPYIQFWAPDDGWRDRLKHVEHFTEVNKFCNVAYFWLYLKICLRCTDPWTSKIPDGVFVGEEWGYMCFCLCVYVFVCLFVCTFVK